MLHPTFLSFDYYIGVSVNNFTWLSFTACIIALTGFVSLNFTPIQFFITGGLVAKISVISFLILRGKNQEEIA